MTRVLVLLAALIFICGFAFLTYHAAVEEGVGVGSGLSALILLLLAVGIIGALRNPPS